MLISFTAIDLIASLTLAVMLILIFENSRFKHKTKRKFYLAFLFIYLAMTAEWLSVLLNGGPQSTVFIHRMLKCLDYCLTPISGFMIIRLATGWNRFQKCVAALLVFNILLQVISIFTGWTYDIDANNYYYHGPAYMLYVAIYGITLLCLFYAIYRYGAQFKRHNRGSLVVVMILIVTAVVLQEVWGYKVCYLTLTVSVILLYIHYSEFYQLTNDDVLREHKNLLQKDVLTGLYSRYAYTEDLKALESQSSIPDHLAIFSVDINELKMVNDHKGHLAGDELIQGASACIDKVLGSYGKCYRTGGDEFIAILYLDAEKAYQLQLQLREAADTWQGTLVDHLSLSIGYVLAADNAGIHIDKLINMADEKMYEAKAAFYMQAGKNRRLREPHREASVEQKQKEYMDIISALASDITGLYVIDRFKQEVMAYRLSKSDHRIRSGVPLEQGFEKAMAVFINKHVHPDDREMMTRSIRMDHIQAELADRTYFVCHFRTTTGGSLGYHYMKCLRNNENPDYDKIIVAFCPEDNVSLRKRVTDLVKTYNPALFESGTANTEQIVKALESLEQIETDDLTGLFTRQAFLYHAKVLLDASPKVDFMVLLVDILNFKLYNSIHGQAKGDQLLKLLAEYCQKLGMHGIVARYGADQIVCIMKDEPSEAIIREMTRMQAYVNEATKENVTLKFGIYEHVDRSLEVTRMCDRALMALKSIKHTYDRFYASFDGPVSQQQLKEQVFEANFKKAIENKEFVVWYQPKYNPYTEKIVGAEALVRWQQGDRMISPAEFLPVFEADGLISQLDEYVFKIVCAQQKKWHDRGKKVIPISVNLSRNSMHQSDVVARYKAIVDACGILPEYVPIEITESAATGNMEIKPLADTFFKSGFVLHMDDYGSGKSSVAGLTLLHFDTVKLDKSLIDCIGQEEGQIVLMYTVALSKELGLHLVAEGVETQAQVDYLKDIGCDTVQGYYFCKPLPVEEFEKQVTESIDDMEEKYDYRYKLTAVDSLVKRAMDRMLQRMPGGFFTYRALDGQIISSNSYLWHIFGCDSEAEFMTLVDGTFRGMVVPEDYDQVESFIQRQIEHDENEMDYVEYRIRRKDGKIVRVVDYGHLDHQLDGDVFYVFIGEANK